MWACILPALRTLQVGTLWTNTALQINFLPVIPRQVKHYEWLKIIIVSRTGYQNLFVQAALKVTKMSKCLNLLRCKHVLVYDVRF